MIIFDNNSFKLESEFYSFYYYSTLAYSGTVGGPGLDGGSGLWSCSLQTHDDLELGVLVDIAGSQLVEGRAGVYPDHEGHHYYLAFIDV